ncbi:hypothetical protein [Cellulomonas cellasea]|uniref:Uncharacterized protein n=1 Tax=Cellulomonas cellasea TaxID=43670 RepID=A0A7W4UE64_9CELL|nr:hypothetical protein [Cellulomonas cellasea]MBB2922521.1 hypothetical protein [Cellulomonas cellasea]
MTVTAGRPGGGRARSISGRGLRLVHAAAGGSASGVRSPGLLGAEEEGAPGAVRPLRLVCGVDLVHELEEQVLELRADGPTVAHRAALADLLVAWAQSLVELHGTPVPSATPAVPLPWVLEPDRLAGHVDGPHAAAGRAWAVRQHPRVRRALAAARAGWATDRWVHDSGPDAVLVVRAPGAGDGSLVPVSVRSADLAGTSAVRSPADGTSDPVEAVQVVEAAHTADAVQAPDAAHVLDAVDAAERAGRRPAPRARLVGTGRGDPRWDVATALDWLAVHLAPTLDPGWDLDPVAGFMRAYRAHGGDAEPDRALAVARTVATAAAWSDALDERAEEPDDDDLAWVAGLWARPLALLAPR